MRPRQRVRLAPNSRRVATRGRFARWSAGICSVAIVCAVGLSAATGAAGAPASCAGGSLYVAAHADDPLLFMLPDLDHDVVSGRCVEVVILTAGDAGLDQGYWQRREAGLASALAVLAGFPDRWRMRDAGIPGHPSPLYSLARDPRVRLVFMRLPDGRFNGTGFGGRGSMRQLLENMIPVLTSLAVTPASPTYSASTYSKQDLIAALTWLMRQATPRRIGVQDYAGALDGTGDHSDHRAGARFALAAAQSYGGPATLVGYLDYEILGYAQNVRPADAAQKEAAWFAYLPYDDQLRGTCPDVATCLSPGNYGNYWSRQYVIKPPIKLGPRR